MFSGIHHEMTLYVQYTKNQAIKKWLPLEIRCAVDLEYIVTIHFVCPYPSLLTLYFQYTKTKAFKKWLPFEGYIFHLHVLCCPLPMFLSRPLMGPEIKSKVSRPLNDPPLPIFFTPLPHPFVSSSPLKIILSNIFNIFVELKKGHKF